MLLIIIINCLLKIFTYISNFDIIQSQKKYFSCEAYYQKENIRNTIRQNLIKILNFETNQNSIFIKTDSHNIFLVFEKKSLENMTKKMCQDNNFKQKILVYSEKICNLIQNFKNKTYAINVIGINYDVNTDKFKKIELNELKVNNNLKYI
jgi:hypothetical protein